MDKSLLVRNNNIKSISKKQRIVWIDNLKLLAAYGVLLGHCYSMFIGQNDYGKGQLSSLEEMLINLCRLIYNGDMWVIVFCMISGYFASAKHFSSFQELVRCCIKRYARFVKPLVILALLITLLQFAVGFDIRSDYVANQWLGIPMNVTLLNLMKMIFLFNPELDNPLWMLRALFIGCIFLYVINFFAFDYLKLRYNAIVYAIFACPLFFAGKWSAEALVTSCVIMGGILRFCWYPKKNINTFLVTVSIGVMLFLLDGGQNMLANIMTNNVLPIHWGLDKKWYTIWWFLILWLLFSRSIYVEKLCGKKLISNDTEHSFYVYILHFIILQTAGTWIFSIFVNELGFGFSAIISTISCLFITAISSVYFGVCYRFLDGVIKNKHVADSKLKY